MLALARHTWKWSIGCRFLSSFIITGTAIALGPHSTEWLAFYPKRYERTTRITNETRSNYTSISLDGWRKRKREMGPTRYQSLFISKSKGWARLKHESSSARKIYSCTAEMFYNGTIHKGLFFFDWKWYSMLNNWNDNHCEISMVLFCWLCAKEEYSNFEVHRAS